MVLLRTVSGSSAQVGMGLENVDVGGEQYGLSFCWTYSLVVERRLMKEAGKNEK